MRKNTCVPCGKQNESAICEACAKQICAFFVAPERTKPSSLQELSQRLERNALLTASQIVENTLPDAPAIGRAWMAYALSQRMADNGDAL